MTAAPLAFVLECAATAAAVGAVAGVASLCVLVLVRPLLARLPPARAADALFLLGVLPALAALATVGAAALPPVLAALGPGEDHCLAHAHHLHLCLVHAGGLRPPLAAVGALALAGFLFRAGHLVEAALRLRARVEALAALGTPHPGAGHVVRVPGAARLCHATGLVRRRILVSEGVARALGEAHLAAALAHEAAHLRRRDALASFLLALAGLLLPPFVGRALTRAFRHTCEEACDAEAARDVGDGAHVADALVRMAALPATPPALGAALGFGEHALERRVRRLLAGTPASRRPARALAAGTLAAGAAALLAVHHAAPLHHVVETLLHHLS